ncbi:MAG TPA: carboxypeptidase regulatory-like domain-containing protein [Acidobacteriaceae bacterium]|nr:carboxypeptidase regulatory-like domain-containing protein [Acidobacteriaceae bacterium]
MIRELRKFIALLSLLMVFGVLGKAPALHAQAVAIASVTGRVVDQAGAVVNGAQIKMTAVDTGIVHNVVTNTDGIYTVPNLPIGAYQLEVTAPGFQTYVQSGIRLQVNDNVQINVSLTVGQVAEKVEVQANASMVQTQQNTISQVIDQRRMVDLPLNGRDPTQLITISGASVNHSDGTNTGSKSFFSSQSISIAGGPGNGTNYLLDGGDNNDNFTNVNMPFPFPDALAEFSVETSSLPARNGLHPGGVVNVVTKSGSNQLHGDLFEFLRNSDANAINYFAPTQDHLKRNQFGGVLGGKIIRDKLFFFGGFQQSNIRQDPTASTAFVPTAAALNGDFSTLDGAGCQANHVARVIRDPSTGLPLTGDHISPSRFDPAAVALAKYLPQTSDPCGKAAWGVPVHSNESQYVGRVDWTISPKHALYGRYFLDGYSLRAYFDPHDILVTAVSGNVERAQTFVLGDTYTLSASTVNSFHFTVGHRSDDRGPNTSGFNAQALGVKNIYQGTKDYLQVSVNNGGFNVGSGIGALGTFSTTSYQEADDVDILRGKHQIAFGVDIFRLQDNQNNHYQDNGTFSFDGRYSNDPLLDFLTGTMYQYTQSLPQLNALRQTLVEAYVQDTYHMTPKLVINAGLRWEPMLPAHDYFNRGSTFSRAAFDAGQTSKVFINAPPGSFYYGDPGVTKSFTHDKWTNLSPRLGIVYNPDGEGKTTLRVGGAYLFDSTATFITYRVNAENPPYGTQISNTSGPYQFSNPWGNIPGGNPFPLQYPPGKDVAFTLATTYDYLPTHIQPTSMAQWNASVQHQFSDNWVFSLSYLGNKTSHLWIGNEVNPAVYIPGTCSGQPCSTTKNTQARRVLSRANPNAGKYYSTVIEADDGINANYNGLLASVEHRFAHNYTVLGNYTWSKCLGIAPETTLGTEGVIENPANPQGDYGPCTYDSPNIVNISMVYSSQFGHGGWVSHILNNWQIAPLVRYQSGLPVNPQTGKDNSLTGIGLDRPNVASLTKYTGAGHTTKLYQYVNPSLYTPNALGTFGDAAHNSLRGPAYTDIDSALSREFALHERWTLDARVEAFNLFNHPNFNGPISSIASSKFGQITTAQDPRILQAAMKLIF